MVSDGEFEALARRVERVERVVAGVDRDVAAVQAQRRADLELLMALRDTQVQLWEEQVVQRKATAALAQHVAAHREETKAGFAAITQILRRLEG